MADICALLANAVNSSGSVKSRMDGEAHHALGFSSMPDTMACCTIGDLRFQLRILGKFERTSRHHTMVNNPAPRSTSHAEDLTSHARLWSPDTSVKGLGVRRESDGGDFGGVRGRNALRPEPGPAPLPTDRRPCWSRRTRSGPRRWATAVHSGVAAT